MLVKVKTNLNIIMTSIITVTLNFSDGKTAMNVGIGTFNKAASEAYHVLSSSAKEELTLRSTERTDTLSAKGIKKEGAKVFHRLQKLVSIKPDKLITMNL